MFLGKVDRMRQPSMRLSVGPNISVESWTVLLLWFGCQSQGWIPLRGPRLDAQRYERIRSEARGKQEASQRRLCSL